MSNIFQILSPRFLSGNLKSKIQNLKWVGIFTIVLTFVVGGVVAQAQQPAGKIARIGYLAIERTPSATPREEAFLQGLRDQGWTEGQNLVIERRYWENRSDRLPVVADELVRLKVDVIVTTSGTAALATKKATSTIPIVMSASADAVIQGIVASLARPGGNVTGLTNISPDIAGKQLELLKEAFPKVSRVAVLSCPSSGGTVGDRRAAEMDAAARALKMHLQNFEVSGPEKVEGALRTATRKGAEAMFVADCSVIPPRVVDLIARTKLPAIYSTARFAEAGALMVYGPSGIDLSRRAAIYVDKILKGAKPADLPVEQPTKFELIINLKTAKQIGVTIPPHVLARADRVIK
ncbi:MAG TPA: ABC transporter substrate-binding protein [Candidatus Binatia bacterium]|nr:ABC transporter substrate-binding protein [Candidatus Binatia bacterium]